MLARGNSDASEKAAPLTRIGKTPRGQGSIFKTLKPGIAPIGFEDVSAKALINTGVK